VSEKEIGLREARAQLGDLVAAAQHGGHITYITRHGRRAAAIVPINRVAPQEQAMTVTLYETNSDLLVIARGDNAWTLHPGDDLLGQFAAHAAAWSTGDWEPNEDDGQTRADLDGLKEVAKWDADNGLTLLVGADSLGRAAREYLPATATTETVQIAEHQQGRGGYSYPLAIEVADILGVGIAQANDEILSTLRQLVDIDGPGIILDRQPIRPELLDYNPNDLDVDYWLTISEETASEIRCAVASQHETTAD
jgi:prevent-host-death family protein